MDTSGIAADVAETTTSAGKGFFGELKKVGQTAFAQLLGGSAQQPTGDQIAQAKAHDDESSEAEAAQIRAKVNAIYQEYAQLKKKEEKLEAEQEKQKEEVEKLEEINMARQAGNVNVDTAVGKASAEMGKNFGSE